MTRVTPVSLHDVQHGSSQPQQFTNDEIAKELAREINLRSVVYPGAVRSGKLTAVQADRQVAILRQAMTEYQTRAQADREEREPSLNFGDGKPADAPATETAPQQQPGSDHGDQPKDPPPADESAPKPGPTGA